MIHFYCQKCGVKIRAATRVAGRGAKCPRCNAELVIPSLETKSKARGRGKKFANKADLVNMTDEQITVKLLNVKPRSKSLGDIFGLGYDFFLPYYDEVSLFAMSITLIILVIISNPLKILLHKILFLNFDIRIILFFVLCTTGIPFSVFHAFSKRQKHPAEKMLMILFATLSTAFISIIAGIHLLKNSQGWLIIFPAWAIINSLIILALFQEGHIDEYNISDRNATFAEIIFSLIIISVIVTICHYCCSMHWAIIFSISTVYVTGFDRALRTVFGLDTDKNIISSKTHI